MMGEAGLGEARARTLSPEPQAKGPALVLATASAPPRVIGTSDKGAKT